VNNVPEHIAELMNKRIASVRRASSHPDGSGQCPGPDHPLAAILLATLEAAIESGLVEPLYMSVQDKAGIIKRSTIQDGVISYDDHNVRSDLRFPLRVVITDEAGNGKMDVSVETEEIGDGWVFRTQVSWLK
jgi:hypothetical protein